MASKLPALGSETTISVTVNGAPTAIDGQVDGWTANPVADTVNHKPLGTHDVEKGQDLGGFKGTITLKRANTVLARTMDLIDASIRAGIKPVIMITATTRYPNLSKDSYLYRDVVISDSETAKRAEFNGGEINWETGKSRVAL